MAKTKRTCDHSKRAKRRPEAEILAEALRIVKQEDRLQELFKDENFLSFEEYHFYLLTHGYPLNSQEYIAKINEYMSEGVL